MHFDTLSNVSRVALTKTRNCEYDSSNVESHTIMELGRKPLRLRRLEAFI